MRTSGAPRDEAAPDERRSPHYGRVVREQVALEARHVNALLRGPANGRESGSADDRQSVSLPCVLELGQGLPPFAVSSIEDFRIVSLDAVTIHGELLTPGAERATLTVFRRGLLRRVACRLIGREATVRGELTSFVPEQLGDARACPPRPTVRDEA